MHERFGVAYGPVGVDGYGVVDHAVFGAFHFANLMGLGLDRHVFVDHTDTALTSDGDGQVGFGHGIHGGRYDGGVDRNVAGETRCDANFARKNFGVGGDEEHVIEGEALGYDFFI